VALQRKPRRPDRAGWSTPAAENADGQPVAAVDMRAKSLALLARREHSRAEMRRKLARAGGDADTIEIVLDALEREKLLSDQRFAEGVARVRGARYGSRRVADDLRRTGVGPEAGALIDSLKASDSERALAIWTRKFGVAPADASARAKQMRFLLARGFPTDVIYRVVPRAGRVEDEA
jgi:regulatory protein